MTVANLDDLAPFTAAGITFNIEQRTALRNAIAIKKHEEKLDQVYFWGKINAVNKDYYILQGWMGEEYFKRKYFYR